MKLPSKHHAMSSRAFVLIIPALAVFSLFTSEGVTRVFRRLAVDCIHNVFSTPSKILSIPAIPTSNASHVPAYLALCQVSLPSLNLLLAFLFSDQRFVERYRNGLGKKRITRQVITKLFRLSRMSTYA